MQDQFASLDGLQVRYRDSGSTGPAVLMTHGIGESLEFWHRQFDLLGESLRLIAWDMPGHGLSGESADAMSLEGQARVAWRLLDQLGVSRVHLVGVNRRFKHPTIGDAYAATLAFSPDLLGIFLSGSATENLLSQVTCGNVGVEKAVIVPKSLFPMMIERLKDFSASDQYKVEWMSSWGARWTLYRFLANRCSKDFLAAYLEQSPDVLQRVAKPGLSLSAVPEVDLAVRLHGFGLLPEEARKAFVETVSTYAVEGEDLHALDDPGVRSVFQDGEFDDLVETVKTDLLPKLAEVRLSVQRSHSSSDPPDEHMQGILESFSTLKKRFGEDEQLVKLIERETDLVNDWISETEPPEPKVGPRVLGAVEHSAEKHGSRSIFDDIAD